MDANDTGAPQPDPLQAWEKDVRGAEYAKAPADGRVLMWRPIATRPTDRAVIVGWASDVFTKRSWFMLRREPGEGSSLATHWREDSLGTPYCAPTADAPQYVGHLPTRG